MHQATFHHHLIAVTRVLSGMFWTLIPFLLMFLFKGSTCLWAFYFIYCVLTVFFLMLIGPCSLYFLLSKKPPLFDLLVFCSQIFIPEQEWTSLCSWILVVHSFCNLLTTKQLRKYFWRLQDSFQQDKSPFFFIKIKKELEKDKKKEVKDFLSC